MRAGIQGYIYIPQIKDRRIHGFYLELRLARPARCLAALQRAYGFTSRKNQNGFCLAPICLNLAVKFLLTGRM